MMGRLARMVALIERYGAAIEYDLHAVCGLDLVDFFRHRYSWRKLDVILERLPSGSAYWAARADDDEAAAAVLRISGNKPRRGAPPPLTEMSRTNQLLLDLLDMQQVVVQRLTVLTGAKAPTIHPAPRPSTGMSRVEDRAEVRQVGDLVAEALAAQARGEATPGAL